MALFGLHLLCLPNQSALVGCSISGRDEEPPRTRPLRPCPARATSTLAKDAEVAETKTEEKREREKRERRREKKEKEKKVCSGIIIIIWVNTLIFAFQPEGRLQAFFPALLLLELDTIPVAAS